ncbi:MAG: hypothetical protein IPG11_17540 [Flavobacteriales bacterium]|nr:hypothetical protein [Flavobacteriales bacterium]
MVHEAAFQFTGIGKGQRLGAIHNEVALLVGAFLHVVVFALGRFHNAEVYTQGLAFQEAFVQVQGALVLVLLGLFAQQAGSSPRFESVCVEVLAGLDVILVAVGPVQHHFLPIVGHGIGGGLARRFTAQVTAAHEVAILVVAFEEAVEVVVHLGLGLGGVHGIGPAALGLLHGIHFLRVRRTEFLGLGQGVLISGLQFGLLAGAAIGKGLLHFIQQVVLQKALHLLGLGVHDAVKPEVELGLVQLEQLLELFDELSA